MERMSRLKAKRWQEQVDTPWGPATVKVKEVAGVRTASPEYDDCVRLAKAHGLSVWELWRTVAAAELRGWADMATRAAGA